MKSDVNPASQGLVFYFIGYLRKLMRTFRKLEETDKVSVKSRKERYEELQNSCCPRTL